MKNEAKKEFERQLYKRFTGATVNVRGKVVINKGKLLDLKWWRNMVDRAWRERYRYQKI